MGRPSGKANKLEERRHEAINLIEKDGLSAADAARRMKIHDRTIRKWLAAYRKDGIKGLTVKVSTGRKRKLELNESKRLQRIILDGAVKAGFPNELWTSKRVLQVIKSKFGLEYHSLKMRGSLMIFPSGAHLGNLSWHLASLPRTSDCKLINDRLCLSTV